MGLTNPPAIVTALSDKLQLVTAWTAVGGAGTTNIYYPVAPAGSAAPFVVIDIESISFTKIAVGARGYPAGTATYTFFLSSASYTIGQAESLAEDIAEGLMDEETGLYLVSAEHGRAIDYDAGEEAADSGGDLAHIPIVVTVTFGLET